MNNDEAVFISVLIPVYRAGKHVSEAVESVFKQHIRNMELIIVNDGSDDDSIIHIKNAIEKAPEGISVSFIDMPHKGQAAARNTALNAARGEWIFYLDADDVLAEDALENLLKGAAEDPEAGIICAKCRDFISPELTPEEAEGLNIEAEPYRRMLSGCTLIKHDVYDQAGGYDESLKSSETAQWMLKVRDAGVRVHNIEDVTMYRRYHRNNFGRTGRNTQLKSYMDIIRQRRGLNGKKDSGKV